MSIPHLDHISAMAQQARLDAMGIADQITQCGATRHDAFRRTPEQIERLCEIRDMRIMTAEFLEALDGAGGAVVALKTLASGGSANG